MPKDLCCGCKKRFDRETMIKKSIGNFHSYDCLFDYAKAKQDKQRERQLAKAKSDINKAKKAARSKHRAEKEAIKTLSQLKSEAQTAFNKYIRARDYFDPCRSCGKSKEVIESEQGWKVGGCWDAGHFKTRGAKPQLRFNVYNCHKQCKSCNAGSGKFSKKAATVDAEYRINLIKKIGIKKVTELENNNAIVRFDKDYCRRIKKIFNKRSRLKQRQNENLNIHW